MSKHITVPVELLEKAAKHVGDLACVVMSYNGGTTNTLLDFEDELRSVLSAARTAPAELCRHGVSDQFECMKCIAEGDPITGTAPEALQAELERLREERDSYQRVGIKAMEERDALKADAERYRWLRGKSRNNIVVRNGVSHLFDELLDRSIDAARTAKPEVKS